MEQSSNTWLPWRLGSQLARSTISWPFGALTGTAWCCSSCTTTATHNLRRIPTTDDQTMTDHDVAWAQLGQSSTIIINSDTKLSTPENALRISSDDSAKKELLREFDQTSEQRMQLALAEHAKTIYQPQVEELQQGLREQNLARETENRQLVTLMQQSNKEEKREISNRYPPEATLDAWADSADQLLGKPVKANEKAETLHVKTNTPHKQEEDCVQLRIKVEAYEIKSGGGDMPDGPVLVEGRVAHDYGQKLQAAIDTLSTDKEYGDKDKKIGTAMITKTKIDKEAVGGNKQATQMRTTQPLTNRRTREYNSPDSNRRDRDDNTPNVMQLGPDRFGDALGDDNDEPRSPGDPGYRRCDAQGVGGGVEMEERTREAESSNL